MRGGFGRVRHRTAEKYTRTFVNKPESFRSKNLEDSSRLSVSEDGEIDLIGTYRLLGGGGYIYVSKAAVQEARPCQRDAGGSERVRVGGNGRRYGEA
eukprot:3226101-Pleurochrysis_carterae.AAC.2